MQIPVYENLQEKQSFFENRTCSLLADEDILIGSNPFFITIESKEKFDEFYDIYSNKEKYIFRGVNEAKYKLYTSIQRNFIEGRINKSKTIESFVSKEIESIETNNTLKSYYEAMGVPVTDYLYLSFLQHYSAPTPFLDFSHDLNVALYFATEDVNYGNGECNVYNPIDEYFSVYYICESDFGEVIKNVPKHFSKLFVSRMYNVDTIQKDWLRFSDNINNFVSWNGDEENGLKSIKLGFIDSDNTHHDTEVNVNTSLSSIINSFYEFKQDKQKTNKNSLAGITELYLNEIIKIINLNLIAQKGCFILYVPDKQDINMPLETYMFKKDPIITCTNIHKSLAPYIKDLIAKKGFCKETIYPEPKNIAHKAFCETLLDI